MKRFNRSYLTLLVGLIVAVVCARMCMAESVVLDAEKMKVALHTSTEQEDGFIEYVVARVKAGTLPIDLVESTFLWAIKKPRKKFFYFKCGLIKRAAAQGINL